MEVSPADVYKELDRLRPSLVVDALVGTPLATLLKREHVSIRTDPHQTKWLYTFSTYEVSFEELAGSFPSRLVALMKERREKAFKAMLPLLVQSFHAIAGANADPNEWRTIVLKDWWLRESSVKGCGAGPMAKTVLLFDADNPRDKPGWTCFIDATYAFERMPAPDGPLLGPMITPKAAYESWSKMTPEWAGITGFQDFNPWHADDEVRPDVVA